MKKKTKLLLWVIVFVLVMGGAAFAYNRLSGSYVPENEGLATTENNESVGSVSDTESGDNDQRDLIPAPDFVILDAEGTEVKLSDRVGERPIVLNFWASWCGPCKAEMPDFDQLFREYDGKVEFMMINMTDGSRETIDSATKFYDESGYSFPIYFDTELSAAAAYSVYTIPVTYIIDTQGNICGYGNGMVSYDAMKTALDAILSEETQ